MVAVSNLSIGISLILRDQFSGRMAQARRELDLTTAAGRRAEKASIESQRNMSAAGAIAGVAALSVMRDWVKIGANFDKQMTYSYSIMTDKGGKSLRELKDRAIEVGQDTMFSTTQIAEAMTSMAQAGQSGLQVFENINATAVLAAATMTDVTDAASTMNSITIGFGIEASEKNAMRVADIVTQSINQADIKLNDFQESIKYIIPTATSLNVSLEEVAAMISTVGNAGIKGSMAGTNTENMLRYLAKATGTKGKGKQAEALAAMGLTEKDLMQANGQLKSMPELITMIGKKLQTMQGTTGFNAMMDIFGVRGGRSANLLAKGMAEYQTALDNINNSGGTSQRVANDVMGTLWGNMERLESTWESFKISFTEAIMPVLIPALQVITTILQMVVNFVKQPVGKFLMIVATGFIALRTGTMIYKTILLSLRLLHLSVGTSAASGTGTAAAGYSRLTASVNTTTAAVNRLNMAQGMGVAGMGRATYNQGRRQWTSNNWGIGRDKAVMQRWNQRYGARAKMARFGGMVGKASPYALVGGLALNAAAGQFDEGSGMNKGLNVAGAGLSGAATGAMLGSIIPGVGTAVGAVVGGVGSILWTLYDQAQAEKEKLKQVKAEAEAMDGKSVSFEAHEWAQQAKSILKSRSIANYHRGVGVDSKADREQYQSLYSMPGYGNGNNKPTVNTQNKITVNIDGTQAFNRMVEDNNYNANVQFNF